MGKEGVGQEWSTPELRRSTPEPLLVPHGAEGGFGPEKVTLGAKTPIWRVVPPLVDGTSTIHSAEVSGPA